MIGMAHRGRLSLAHVLEKPYSHMFAEFKQKKAQWLILAGLAMCHLGRTKSVKRSKALA